MPWLLTLVWAFITSQTLGIAMPLDVSTIKMGAPAVVAELDLGKLKGELRQIGWSSDGSQLYLQTADGDPSNERLRHYTVAVSGAAPIAVDRQPEWAQQYWAHKSDRNAPGAPMLEIDVKQTFDTVKIGTGSAGAADGGDRTGGGTVMSANNIDREAQRQKQNVWRFYLLDQTIAEFVNTRPIPGLTFSWGPRGTGAMAFTDGDGRLVLLDQEKRRQTVSGVKDATLPAWSMDGERLAYAVKTGRRKYKLVWCTITK
jgi:hypothetical protein